MPETIEPKVAVMVSVIVPVYNVERFLRSCLESLLAQDYSHLEVILVNDGSTDGSGVLADEFAQLHPNVRVIHQLNAGVSEARNRGIEAATGHWISFVDADDRLAVDYFSTMLRVSRRLDDPEIVVSTSVLSGEAVRRPYKSWFSGSEKATETLLYPGIPVGCWNKLFSRSLLERHHLRFRKDLTMGEGLAFIINASQRAGSVGFTDYAGYFYRRDNANSATSMPTPSRMIEALKALSVVESDLLSDSTRVRTALEFHRWRTKFLVLAACAAYPDDSSASSSVGVRRSVQVDGVRLAAKARLRFSERLRTLAVSVIPGTAAHLLARRWRRRVDASARSI